MVKLKTDSEIQEFIRSHYLRLLEREPDYSGLEIYKKKIKRGEIKPEKLVDFLVNSKEYKDLQENKRLFEKIDDQVKIILNQNQKYTYLEKSERKPEPHLIFVSCYNGSKDYGGVYCIKDGLLKPIFEGYYSVGLSFEKNDRILFCLLKTEPQIRAFKVTGKKFNEIPIHFENYIYGKGPHSLFINENKIIVIASEGDAEAEKASNSDLGEFFSKIIVSDLEISKSRIKIKNSNAINPFSCSHDHHINDMFKHNGTLFMTSFSYCDTNKNYVKKGTLSKLDNKDYTATVVLNELTYPHSPVVYRDELYVCSSGIGAIFSISLEDYSMKLEYKGVDSHLRGLLITDNYYYVGINYRIGRPNSPFKNPSFGILQFNRDSGETKIIPLPPNCNNIYSIISD